SPTSRQTVRPLRAWPGTAGSRPRPHSQSEFGRSPGSRLGSGWLGWCSTPRCASSGPTDRPTIHTHLQERNAKIGIAIQGSMADERRQRDHEWQRVVQDMRAIEVLEAVESNTPVAAAVDRQHAVELHGFLVDWPVVVMA